MTPRSVIYFGDDRFGLLRCFADFGVTKLSHVGSQSIFNNSNSSDLIEFEEFDFDVVYESGDTFDLCITVGDVDEMDLQKAQNLIDSCIRSSGALFFVVTPPGESGAAGPGSRPMRWWVAKFWEKGFRFHDVIRPSIEPLRFSYSYSPIYKVGSSKFSNIFLVKREESDNENSSKLLEKVMVEKESRIEDLSLQAVYTDILMHDLLIKSKSAQDQLAECFRKIDELQDQKNKLARQLPHFQKIPQTVLSIHLRVLGWISESPRILKVLRHFSRK